MTANVITPAIRLSETSAVTTAPPLSRELARLASDETLHRVDGIADRLAPDRFRYTSAVGSVVWRWSRTTGTHIEQSTGVDLLALDVTDRFVGLESERDAQKRLPNELTTHGRPYAYESLAQLFDDPKTPDTLLVPAAGFPQHANPGNHGSLTTVQSRALFLAAGRGVRAEGWIDAHARVIDVAPTVLALLGLPSSDAHDGRAIDSIRNGESARHVVAVLLDGANTNLVADAVEHGELPTLAALLGTGTGLRHGMVSSFPTVTLPNHMSAFTGVHPGRHGIINNEFLGPDGSHVNLLDFRQMVNTCSWLSDRVETLHESIHRHRPDNFTSSIYEYADRGASWSTFDEFRSRRRPFTATVADGERTASAEAYALNEAYRFMSRVDESAVGTAIEQWGGVSRTGHPLPTLQLLTLNLTDAAGHASGPLGNLARASLVDSDARLARLLDAIDAAGAASETAVIVLSDHGMEQCDLAGLEFPCADLSEWLDRANRRDVGDALLYPKSA